MIIYVVLYDISPLKLDKNYQKVNNLIMSLLLSIFMSLLSISSFVPMQESKIIASCCYLYSHPSFESEKIYDDNGQAVVLNLGDKIEIIQDDGGDFVLAKEAEHEGYIYRYYISATGEQLVYPSFNGTLRKESLLFDNNLVQTAITLKEGERLFLYDGYDDKREYTPVQVVLEDGSLYNGLILTSNIKPDGISSLLIIGITIIAASVTIILSLIFIKKSKDKKKKQKNWFCKIFKHSLWVFFYGSNPWKSGKSFVKIYEKAVIKELNNENFYKRFRKN